MGTTSDKLLYLNSTKAAIKAAINALPNGPYIEDGATFRSYEHAVEAAGVGCMVAATDEAAWYILSPSNMFTDRAGTTPVTVLDDFVGLIMDSSQGQELGAELVPSGDLTAFTSVGSAAVNSITQFTLSANGSGNRVASGSLGPGNCVTDISFRAKADKAGTIIAWNLWSATKTINVTTNYEMYSFTLADDVASHTQFLGFYTNSDSPITIDIDTISVKKINGNHFTAVSDAGRALYKTDGTDDWFQLDKVDDNYSTTFASPIVGTMLIGTRKGTIHLEVNIPAGAWSLTPTAAYFPGNTVTDIIIKNGYMTAAELANAKAWLASRGSPVVYTPTGTDLFAGFRAWAVITKIYTDNWDTSGATSITQIAQSASNLADFDASNLDTTNIGSGSSVFRLSGVTTLDLSNWVTSGFSAFDNFANAALSLQTVIVNGGTGSPFSDSAAVNYLNAFANTNLTQQSIDDIIVAVNAAGTSNGIFTQSGGSAPSVIGEAAIDAMRARGWTVAVTGGY